MKRHPYLAVFLIGWAFGVPYALIADQGRDLSNKMGFALGAGFIGIVAGWIAIYRNHNQDIEERFRSGVKTAVTTSSILIGLALLGWYLGGSGQSH